MAILLLVGEAWIRRSGRSPEWWDSWVIMLWVRSHCIEFARGPMLILYMQGIGLYRLLHLAEVLI